jgi:hypothetical protein
LCIDWGFCIDPAKSDKIAISNILNADEFACTVIEAEGMDAEVEIEWRRKIRNRFIEKFGNEINENGS